MHPYKLAVEFYTALYILNPKQLNCDLKQLNPRTNPIATSSTVSQAEQRAIEFV